MNDNETKEENLVYTQENNINTKNKSFKKPSIPFVLILAVLVFSAALIISAWLISNTGFSIRSSGSVGSGGVSQVDSVAVNGLGKVLVQPDIATIRVSAREEAKSAQEAQQKLNAKVNALIDAMKKAGVKEDDINTNSYSAYNYWWWDWDYERTVTQSFQVKVRNIDDDREILEDVVDAIIGVDAQTGWYIAFDLDDKTEAYADARELAYEKALQKAEQLAEISKIKLGDVRYINDQSRDSFVSETEDKSYSLDMLAESPGDSNNSSTNIPVGDIEVTVELDVQFEIL